MKFKLLTLALGALFSSTVVDASELSVSRERLLATGPTNGAAVVAAGPKIIAAWSDSASVRIADVMNPSRPLAPPRMNAAARPCDVSPAMGSNGDAILLVWCETDGYLATYYAARVQPDLSSIAMPRILGFSFPAFVSAPAVVRSDDGFTIALPEGLLTTDTDGVVTRSRPLDVRSWLASGPRGVLATWVRQSAPRVCGSPGLWGFPLRCIPAMFSLFTTLVDESAESTAPAAIAAGVPRRDVIATGASRAGFLVFHF